ncbi:hypothetical protein FHG87_004056 [Trinorchestia longiramus]|nr:hypothetical protein FHG87_004056 [Trinorchestia longiramus]
MHLVHGNVSVKGIVLKYLYAGPPSSKKPNVSNTGDAYRAALAATLRQRFQSVHGSDDDTEAEFSDSDAVKSGRWDSEAWQCPVSTNKSSLPQALVLKERLRKTSPVKLAKEIKNSPDALLAAVNEKLYCAVSEDQNGSSGALIFSTPKLNLPLDDPEDKVPDSNELFRKFLQSDRKKRIVPLKKSPSRSQSTPNFAPLVRSVSTQDTIQETPQTSADAGEERTPVVSSILKPRALSFSTETQQSPFGQHLLRKRVSLSNAAKTSNGSASPSELNDDTKVSSATADQTQGNASGDQVSVEEKGTKVKETQNKMLCLSFESGDPQKLSSARLQTNQ